MERLISNIKIALKGNVKPRKMLGVVGSERGVSWEVTNTLDPLKVEYW